MRITFLAHSGFLIELDGVCLLFDWWKGSLPDLPEGKPLLVFASHRHEDHFDPAIFSLDNGSRPVRFLLGKDIKLSPRNMEKWGLSDVAANRCICLGGNKLCQPMGDVQVETLPSTDEGVAFLVTADGQTIFHAGDLNWWHWEGEDKGWNRNMEVNFKRYTEPLRGRRLDLAMLPLDHRLGEPGFWGPRYYLETADVRTFLPMHQWEHFEFTDQFLSVYPQFEPQTVPIRRNGQVIQR